MTSEVDEVPTRQVQSLLRELVLNKNGIALLVAVLLSAGLLVGGASASGATHTVVTGLGTSLLASAAFAALFLALVSRAEQRLLQTAIDTQAEEVAGTVVEQVRELQRRFVPTAVYRGSQEFSYQFNRDLTDDLEGTTRYIYYGLTGKYVGARLLNIGHQISYVDVVIGDPGSEDSARTRQRHEASGVLNGKIRRTLEEQVDHCIIGLFNARHRHGRITLYITNMPNYDRVEVTDAAAYLTLFTTQENQPFLFPDTLRFPLDADFYEMMRRDAERAVGRSNVRKIEIEQTWTEDDLRDCYADELGRNLGPEELGELKARFDTLRDGFDAQIQACEPLRS